MGDDNKSAALIFLILGAFLFWLHSQGKLIPLFQQLFGIGVEGQKAALPAASPAPAAASSGSAMPANPTLLEQLEGVAITALKNSPKPAPNPVQPLPTPAPGNPGPLPGFSPTLQGTPGTGEFAGWTMLPPAGANP